uniref:Uncharacterized protein n=1 Tax=virus sp. ctx9V1 TaxID=2828001 RepID=A0A8S5RDV5_9VIRU|nr:MAG TPA: hypothetical protein [virus sp. ctx9V1]
MTLNIPDTVLQLALLTPDRILTTCYRTNY